MRSSSQTVLGYLHSLLSHPRGAAVDDRELLRRFTETRDGDAFAALMQRHGPMVLGLARRVVGDSQLAEDVFQATFLMLSRKAHTIRRAESLPCWLHGVAFRLALRVRRSQKRRQERETYVRTPQSPTPLDELTAQEFLAVLDEELQKLPENQRAPLILCCLEGLSQEEAARRLGCSAGAVKGRLERGRQRLHVRLEKRGLTLPAVFGGTLLIAGAVKAVPPLLVQSTLRAAMSGIGAAPAAAALVEETMKMMFIYKLKVIGAAVMLFALTGTGVGMMALRPQTAKENAPPAAASNDKPVSPDKRVDLYGDPLPEGVLMRLGTIQRRAVNAQIAMSADGKSVFSVRAGKYLRIWDAQTGKLCEKHKLPGDSFNSLAAFSPDGRLLAVHNRSAGEVRIWDIADSKIIRILSLAPHAAPLDVFVPSIAFAPDGKNIAVDDQRGVNPHTVKQRIRVWNIKSGKEIFCQEIQQRTLTSADWIVLGMDGERLMVVLVSGVSDSLRCWDVAAGRLAWQRADIRLDSIAITPDGKILWSSPPLQVVDLATGRTVELKHPPPIHSGAGLSLTPDGRTLLADNGADATVWDWRQGKKLRTLTGAGAEIVVAPDGKSIIANNGALQRWDLATGKPLWPDTFEQGHIGEVYALAFSADGKRLASGSTDGSVRLWDAATGRPLRVWRGHRARRWILPHPDLDDGTVSLDISADGRWVLSAGGDDCLKLWNAAMDKEVRTILAYGMEKGVMIPFRYRVRIDRDGERALALFGCFPGDRQRKYIHKLAVWNLKTGEPLARHSFELPWTLFSSYSLCFAGRLARLNNVLVDVDSGKEIVRLRKLKGETAAISRQGAWVAGVAEDGGLGIWESATGKLAASFKNIKKTAQVVFHPNNRFLATNDLDGIQLWDVSSGKRVAQFRAPEPVLTGNELVKERNINCLAFTADGRRLAAGMPDGTILVWDIRLPAPKSQRLEAKESESLWTDLADADKAWPAIWRLADAPQDALAFLHGRVKPYPTAPAETTGKLLADLDNDSFERREAAVKQLKALGPQAEPALRAALKAKPSLEQKKRIEMILDALRQAPQPPTPEGLRQLRALIVLERIAEPEARRLLEKVAQGPPSAALTRQARAALACQRR